MTLDRLLNYIDEFTTNDQDQYYVELSLSRFFSFQHLIEEAIAKIMANGYYQDKDINPQLQSPYRNQQIKAFLKFALEFTCYKLYYPIRGPCGLSVDFYLKGGSYFLNSYFLFGTPSQFRR
jgi:hypothetical protein